MKHMKIARGKKLKAAYGKKKGGFLIPLAASVLGSLIPDAIHGIASLFHKGSGKRKGGMTNYAALKTLKPAIKKGLLGSSGSGKRRRGKGGLAPPFAGMKKKARGLAPPFAGMMKKGRGKKGMGTSSFVPGPVAAVPRSGALA